jgi:molecular chaperone HscB
MMIAPFPPGTDYFAALGLPRKLQIDCADLERRYHELSRRFHPDFFQTASPHERRVSLENSALVNKAYRTLRDPLARTEYLVRLEAGTGPAIEAEAPQALFEEILELNELLAQYRLAAEEEQAWLRSQLDAKHQEFQGEYRELLRRLVEELFPVWDRGIAAHGLTDRQKTGLLTEMSRIIGHRAYLRRVLSNLEEASSAS